MAKFKNIFTNMFAKSSYKLETDAAIIPHGSNDDAENKNENGTNSVHSVTTTTGSPAVNSTLSATLHDHQVNIIDPERPPNQQLQPVNPTATGSLTQNIVNNVQNNALTAPQTSITNATGVQVYQIKNARNVHIGNSFTFNSANTEEERRPSGNINSPVKWANLKLSDTIRQMMDCEDVLDTDMMITVSRHLGYEWKHFARTLEYSEGQIEAFECDNDTLSESIYQFVLDWSRNDDDPTLGKMVNLLWENKHKETVYHMKLLWKKRRQNQVD